MRRLRALMFSRYPCSLANARIFSRVSSVTSGLSRSARETVILDTPASLARSSIVNADSLLRAAILFEGIDRSWVKNGRCGRIMTDIFNLSQKMTSITFQLTSITFLVSMAHLSFIATLICRLPAGLGRRKMGMGLPLRAVLKVDALSGRQHDTTIRKHST